MSKTVDEMSGAEFEQYKKWFNAMEKSLLQRTKRIRKEREQSAIIVSDPGREVLRICHTDTGFDVIIPDGITMTEAAEKFIESIRPMLANCKPLSADQK